MLPPKSQFFCGGHPITLARIRDWQRAFKGAPSQQVPFGAHAVKYLIHLLESRAALGEFTLEEVEKAVGNADPPKAPWIVSPRPEGQWNSRYEGQSIPYQRKDQGTYQHPQWEGYEEDRHESGSRLTSPEARDEQQLRERERAKDEANAAASDHASTLSDAVTDELSNTLAKAQPNRPDEQPPEEGADDGEGDADMLGLW